MSVSWKVQEEMDVSGPNRFPAGADPGNNFFSQHVLLHWAFWSSRICRLGQLLFWQ